MGSVQISLWMKYHLLSCISKIFSFSVFLIVCIKINFVIGFLIGFLFLFFSALFLHSIKCPKCNKSIDNWTTFCSGNNDGMFVPMSKKCKTCGFDFTKNSKDEK